MVKISLNGKTMYLQLLSVKGCDAIQPKLNCFIFDDNFRRKAQWVPPLLLRSSFQRAMLYISISDVLTKMEVFHS